MDFSISLMVCLPCASEQTLVSLSSFHLRAIVVCCVLAFVFWLVECLMCVLIEVYLEFPSFASLVACNVMHVLIVGIAVMGLNI